MQDDAIWLLFRGALYHQAPGTTGWERFEAADVLATLRLDYASLYFLTADGEGLFIGGDTGLWRFDTTRHTWAEIAPVVSSLADTKVRLFPGFTTVDKDFVYQLVGASAEGLADRPGSLLLQYDRKGNWQSLSAPELGLLRFGDKGRVWGDGLTAWYLGGAYSRRRDPTTGKWQPVPTFSGTEWEQVVGDPAQPGVAYLRGKTGVQRYDPVTGKVQTVANVGDFVPSQERNKRDLLPPDAELSDLFFYKGQLIVVTTKGQYRLDPATGVTTRLPLPIVAAGIAIPAEDGSIYLSNDQTIVRLPR